MAQLFKNNSESTLAVAINSTDVVPMNIQVAAGQGDRFPLIATVGADYFDITLESAAGLVEIFRIKQRTSGSDVLVVDSRARENTAAQNWTTSPATVVGLRLTSAAIETVLAHPAVATAAHAASAISYAGSTNLSATNVEAALDELDSEKESVGAATAAMNAHLAAADPHPTYTTAAELTSALAGKQPIHSNLTAISEGNATIAWPVGSVYTSIVSTNPATLLGGGTWVSFGAGRVLVGLDATQTEFDTVEETGGAKTHTLTTAEMPAHLHAMNADGRLVPKRAGYDANIDYASSTGSAEDADYTGSQDTGLTGGGGAHTSRATRSA